MRPIVSGVGFKHFKKQNMKDLNYFKDEVARETREHYNSWYDVADEHRIDVMHEAAERYALHRFNEGRFLGKSNQPLGK